MKVLSKENGQLEISQIYNPVAVIGSGGQKIGIVCRDGGIELYIYKEESIGKSLYVDDGELIDMASNEPIYSNGKSEGEGSELFGDSFHLKIEAMVRYWKDPFPQAAPHHAGRLFYGNRKGSN